MFITVPRDESRDSTPLTGEMIDTNLPPDQVADLSGMGWSRRSERCRTDAKRPKEASQDVVEENFKSTL